MKEEVRMNEANKTTATPTPAAPAGLRVRTHLRAGAGKKGGGASPSDGGDTGAIGGPVVGPGPAPGPSPIG
jgi:hypothetical protein